MNARDDHHEQVGAWLDEAQDDLVTTPLIVAEVDHLVGVRGGRAALSGIPIARRRLVDHARSKRLPLTAVVLEVQPPSSENDD